MDVRTPTITEVIVNLIGQRYTGDETADLIDAGREAYERRVWNLWKGAMVLAALRNGGMTLKEITARTGWSKSTASRIINHPPEMPGVWYVDKSLVHDGPRGVDEALGHLLGEDIPADRLAALMLAAQESMARRRRNSAAGGAVIAALHSEHGMDWGEISHLLNTTPDVVESWADQAPVSTYGEV